jgi:DNA (cytosine-5)-methyltransferase 1
MNYLDLFHGIGGFALGAYWAGMKFENHFCSDIEPFAVKLYKKRFPDSIQLGDITKIDWHKLKNDYPGEWIITGGFPCQDISIAGKGKGLIDEETGEKTRSGLWFDYQKGISILQPKFAIMENVAALTIRGIDDVLGSLAEIGYNAEWQDIRAEDMGAPHRRERIWIVAYTQQSRREGSKCGIRSESKEFERKESINLGKKQSGEMADTTSNRRKREWKNAETEKGLQPRSEYSGKLASGSKRCSIEVSNTNNKGLERGEIIRRTKEVREKRKQQFKRQNKYYGRAYWSAEPSMGRLANGIPNRVDRLKGLGNAIIPQIAEMLFNLIKDH